MATEYNCKIQHHDNYFWWEVINEQPPHQYQLAKLTEEQDELIHANKLQLLYHLLADGRQPRPAYCY